MGKARETATYALPYRPLAYALLRGNVAILALIDDPREDGGALIFRKIADKRRQWRVPSADVDQLLDAFDLWIREHKRLQAEPLARASHRALPAIAVDEHVVRNAEQPCARGSTTRPVTMASFQRRGEDLSRQVECELGTMCPIGQVRQHR